MGTAKEFLNPCSMMTPGVAGALTMTVANTITMQFKLEEPWPAVVALGTSFLFGLLVLTAEAMPVWRKLAFYVVNSLIIFTVAVGSNTLGGTAYAASPEEKKIPAALGHLRVTDSIAIPAAHAQPAEGGWCCLNNKVNQASAQECGKWGGQFFPNEDEARRACQANSTPSQKKEERFFRPWFQSK